MIVLTLLEQVLCADVIRLYSKDGGSLMAESSHYNELSDYALNIVAHWVISRLDDGRIALEVLVDMSNQYDVYI